MCGAKRGHKSLGALLSAACQLSAAAHMQVRHFMRLLHTHAHTHTRAHAHSGEQEVNEALDNALAGQAGCANFSQDLSTCRAAAGRTILSLSHSMPSLSLPLSLTLSTLSLLSLSNVLCMLSELSVSQNCSCFIAHSSSLAAAANGASQLLFYPHIIFTTFLAYNKICACAQKSIITSQ